MSFASDVVGGGAVIGDQMQSVDLGTTITKLNAQVWGRSGVFFNPASYPTAATIDYLKAYGDASTQTTNYNGVTYGDIATDNASKWVIAYGDATNVLVSTDNGATFATVAHNAGGPVVSVSYDSVHDLFIGAGNSAGAFYVCSVAAASVASAWTARTGTAITGGTVQSAKVRSLNGTSVITCMGGTTGNASYSTNGTSWAAKNLASALGNSAGDNLLAPMGGGVWVSGAVGALGNRTTDDGQTWSSITFPVAPRGMAKNSSILLIVDGSGNFYSSTTGATGSWTSLGKGIGAGYNVFSNMGGCLQTDGTKFYCSVYAAASSGVDGRIAISSDGVTWKIRTIINRSWADNSQSNAKVVLGLRTNGDFVLAPMVSNSGACYGNFSTVTGVGIPRADSSSTGIQQLPATTTYVRIS